MRSVRRHLLIASILVLALPTITQAVGDPVVAATKRTAAAKSATFQMNISMRIPGQGTTTLTGTGAQRGQNVKMSMRARAGGAAFRMDARLLKERGSYVMYMRSPLFDAQLPPGKTWIRFDLAKQAAKLGLDFSSLLSVSQTYAPLESGIVSSKRIGREVVAGRTTTRYRAIIDVRRAARAVPAYGKQVATLERITGVRLGRMPYDIWVGSDGRIRRMRFATPTAGGGGRGTTVQTITFLAFDTAVTIAAPPRAEVVSL
jgi:hypothetical protein